MATQSTPLSTSIAQRLTQTPATLPGTASTLSARRALLAATACLAVPAAILVNGHLPHSLLLPLLALALLAVLVEIVVNSPLTAARQGALYPSEALFAAALYWDPGAWVVASGALATLGIHLVWRSRAALTIWAMARNSLACSVALIVALAAPDDLHPVGVVIGMASATLVRAVLARAVERTRPEDAKSRRIGARAMAYHFALVAALGLALGHFATHSPWWILPVLVLATPMLREYVGRGARQGIRDLLQTLLGHLHDREDHGPTTAAELVVLSLETVFGSTTSATVTVFDSRGSWSVSRGSDGDLVREPATGVMSNPRVTRALGQGPVVVGTTRAGATFTAVIGTLEAPLGVLDVRWSGQPSLGRPDRERVARMLVAYATQWLQTALDAQRAQVAESAASAVSGDVAALAQMGDDTRPALEALRRATRNVASLSPHTSALTIAAIVDDLQSAGSAVAALVGAASASGNPEAARAARTAVTDLLAPEPASVPLGVIRSG